MSLLYLAYLQDDLDRFQNLLASATFGPLYTPKNHGSIHNNSGIGFATGSPGASLGTSPRNTAIKGRKSLGYPSSAKGTHANITKNDVNARDYVGLTILHRAASSVTQNSVYFALALLDCPLVDLYLQDYENGWTALHRALYFGNVTVARAILQKDLSNGMKAGSIIKLKDFEGSSPFDLYNSSVARRLLDHKSRLPDSVSAESESGDSMHDDDVENHSVNASTNICGDELFVFGSNKNYTLGLGDQDDRQHPERVVLRRPDHLIRRFYGEYVSMKAAAQEAISTVRAPKSIHEMPILIRSRPIVIQDVILSKLHSAVITTDPESNLYICGFGPGGRLGTGDEQTRFEYVCIESGGLAGKMIVAVALGLNHSMAVTDSGELFSWGSNGNGQLGYALPRPSLKDEEPIQTLPRQIFGPMKRELVKGVAASDIHSVAYTSTSLFTWGKNEGQLGLMDSDSRSFEIQPVPRKVAASLFSSAIQMVSAINRATICLLENHSVCVFTSYGYSFVKFPVGEPFSNYFLKDAPQTTHYEAEPNHINSVTSGGETIAAVSSRGDLFTVNINQKLDTSLTATSTTNPSKIRSALSQPQRIWSLRKGFWDGIKSVDVGENGTVILNTNAGAVWHRVKRLKVKDAHASSLVEAKPKDYKFQRISNLTNIASVKSNSFGGYAAIRKDNDVMKNQIRIDEQKLWDDMAPLLSIRGLEASELKNEDTETPKFWIPALSREHFQPMKRAVLGSPDLEADVSRHLLNKGSISIEYDVEVSTTVSDVGIPIHGFILTGRSSVLRQAWSGYKANGHYLLPEVLEIELLGNGKTSVKFHGIDFITLLNLVVYIYNDTVVDVWQFTKHAPRLSLRYRAVRTELMKVASKLGMTKLEASVRYMIEPERQLHHDLDLAIRDTSYFEDGDVIVELDGDEVQVHSAIMCQRCPFFNGLFHGRAEGQWLEARRGDNSEPVRVDLAHVDPSTFEFVRRYIYSDVGVEIFDDIMAPDLDEFCDIVMDVMAVANELMLDRLVQMCQQILGRFINTRNVCHLLNAISPCACKEFKNAGFEYITLQLECMLENRLLDDLDEDLLLELDDVVKSNQLTCMPFAKSGRAELLLHDRNTGLIEEIGEERQRRMKDMVFRIHLKDDENRLSSSYRARFGSLDDNASSPTQDKARRKSRTTTRNAPFSPALRAKVSTTDLMFDMEDEPDLEEPASNRPKPSDWSTSRRSNTGELISSRNVSHEVKVDVSPIPSQHIATRSSHSVSSVTLGGKPWSSTPLSSTKLDMKEIMSQASTNRTSNLSMGFFSQKENEKAAATASVHKMSQKERKKQQQQALQQATSLLPMAKASTDVISSSPWQVQTGAKTSLKDVISHEVKNSPPHVSEVQHSPIPALSLRRTASPDTRFAGQSRPLPLKKNSGTPSVPSSKLSSTHRDTKPQATLIPHSKSYTTQPSNAEPALMLSMSDIIGQQKREQDLIKEAVAKRSLQEIQEEQAFQAWWDAESKRAQEEEAERLRVVAADAGKKEKGRKGRGGDRNGGRETGRGRGGKGRGKGNGQFSNSVSAFTSL